MFLIRRMSFAVFFVPYGGRDFGEKGVSLRCGVVSVSYTHLDVYKRQPTIARVKVHYDIFLDSYERQKNLQALTNRLSLIHI